MRDAKAGTDIKGNGSPPASSNKTLYFSESRLATTAPDDPAPTNLKLKDFILNTNKNRRKCLMFFCILRFSLKRRKTEINYSL